MGKNFELVSSGIDTAAALAQLEAQPSLWNATPGRRGPTSPHRETQDIWLRWRDPDVGSPSRPGPIIHWPAWFALPAVAEIVKPLVLICAAEELGGVLITKIPSGGQVYPHHDRGGWHAEHFNCKLYVPLRGPAECVNYCEDEQAVMKAGEAWRFDNLKTHWVVNDDDEDRVTLIICMRTESRPMSSRRMTGSGASTTCSSSSSMSARPAPLSRSTAMSMTTARSSLSARCASGATGYAARSSLLRI